MQLGPRRRALRDGRDLTEGELLSDERLVVTSRMEEGVIFGDGMEADRLRFDWGTRCEVFVAERRLRLVSA
jgi:hypothetical protein